MAGPEGLETEVLFVQAVVVVPAQQGQVVGFGLAEVAPVQGVVGVAERGVDVAARPSAAAVAHDQQLVQGVGDGAGLAAVVADRGVAVGDHPVDPGVTGQASDRVGGDLMGAQPADPGAGDQVLVGDRGHDLGFAALDPGRDVVVFDHEAGHRHQRVGAALGGGA